MHIVIGTEQYMQNLKVTESFRTTITTKPENYFGD